MKKQFLLALIAITISSIVSCQKDDTNTSIDNVIITSPATGQTFQSMDTVPIRALLQNSSEMHGLEVSLVNLRDTTVVFQMDEHVHGISINLDTFWINNVMMHSDMRLYITAEIDHEGTTVTDSVSFHCHPSMTL
jgi:hypothetical protein